jgi:hypothetical protein
LFRKLVSLRIPSCWIVAFNSFVEFADDELATPEDARRYLSEDLLSIERVEYSDDRWKREPDGWLLDLGWSDPGDPTGEYVLTVLRGNWDRPTATFRNRSVGAIQSAIDLAFEEILAGRTVEELAERFVRLSDEIASGRGCL